MPDTFFASDHHLGHANIVKFTDNAGNALRAFSSIEDHDEHIIAQHNSVVGSKDTCWFGGDVVINRRYLHLIKRFNGRKRLVLGNHDIFKNKDYFNAGFEDLHAFRKFDDFVLTHIPVHEQSLGRWGVNVHGHLHSNVITQEKIFNSWIEVPAGTVGLVPDQRYINVCMEQLDNYTPISIDQLRNKFNG